MQRGRGAVLLGRLTFDDGVRAAVLRGEADRIRQLQEEAPSSVDDLSRDPLAPDVFDDMEPPAPVTAAFEGFRLDGASGFSQPLQADVTFVFSCWDGFCTSLPSWLVGGDDTWLLFTSGHETDFRVQIGICGGDIFEGPNEALLDSLVECAATGRCEQEEPSTSWDAEVPSAVETEPELAQEIEPEELLEPDVTNEFLPTETLRIVPAWNDHEGRARLRAVDPEAFASDVAMGFFDPPQDQLQVIVALQVELERMGCFQSRVDGDWGRGSRAAVDRYFDELGEVESPGNEPTVELWRMILLHGDVECPRPPPTPPFPARQPAPTARGLDDMNPGPECPVIPGEPPFCM